MHVTRRGVSVLFRSRRRTGRRRGGLRCISRLGGGLGSLLRLGLLDLDQIERIPEAVRADAHAQVTTCAVRNRHDAQLAILLENLARDRDEVAVAGHDDDRIDGGATVENATDVARQLHVGRVLAGVADQHVLRIKAHQREVVRDFHAGVGVERRVGATEHHRRLVLVKALLQLFENAERQLSDAQAAELFATFERQEQILKIDKDSLGPRHS